MGFGSHGEGATFLTVTKGKIVNKKKNIKADWVEGLITKIELKDGTFENQKTLKGEVTILDMKSKEQFKLQFSAAGWYSQGFFARTPNLNFSLPTFIGAFGPKDDDKKGTEDASKVSFCYMKQNGAKIEKIVGTPQPEKVTFNRQEQTSWDKFLAFAEVEVARINAKLKELGVFSAEAAETNTGEEGHAVSNAKEDDLPF